MNTITYCSLQKKAAPKPTASSQPPKTTARSEAGPAVVPDETRPEPSGGQNNVEVRFHFVRLATGAYNKSCREELGD